MISRKAQIAAYVLWAVAILGSIIAKLTGIFTTSWWWVLGPLWIFLGLAILLAVIEIPSSKNRIK